MNNAIFVILVLPSDGGDNPGASIQETAVELIGMRVGLI
jgi:hypothetical protein